MSDHLWEVYLIIQGRKARTHDSNGKPTNNPTGDKHSDMNRPCLNGPGNKSPEGSKLDTTLAPPGVCSPSCEYYSEKASRSEGRNHCSCNIIWIET